MGTDPAAEALFAVGAGAAGGLADASHDGEVGGQIDQGDEDESEEVAAIMTKPLASWCRGCHKLL
jgi:hypothetical protein